MTQTNQQNSATSQSDHLWTVREMAVYLGVSEWTVRQFLRHPEYPGLIRIGRAIRLHPAITLKWLKTQSDS